MNLDLVIYAVSVVLVLFLNGAFTALQIVAYSRPDRSEGEAPEEKGFVPFFFKKAAVNYLAMGLARVLAIAFFILASYRLALRLGGGLHLSLGGLGLVFISVAGVVGVSELLAVRHPERVIRWARWSSYTTVLALRPLALAAVAVVRRLGPRALDACVFPVLPLKRRIELFGSNGLEETEGQALVSSAFEFGETKVREVMVPRIDMVAVNLHTDPGEALDVILEAGHSRVPVFDETIDRIVGVLHTQDILKRIVGEERFSIGGIMREAYFVPESKKIDELLSEFRKRRIHLAIVVDEYGGTAGLVTLEDVLEELVGDIQDEFDTEEELIRRVDDDTALCSARVRLDELNEALGLDLPEGDVDTLGGFLYETIGRVPKVGEFISRSGLEFRIQSVVRQRIDKVLIKGLGSLQKGVESNAG